MKEQQISITTFTILKTIAILLGLGLLFVIKDIIVSLFLAFIIMAALNPTVSLMERNKIPRALGILISYVIILSFVTLLLAFVIPPLTQEASTLFKTLEIPALPSEFWQFQFDVSALGSVFSQLGTSISSVIGIVSSTFSGILFVVTVLVMGFYLLLDRYNLHNHCTWFSEDKKFKELAKEYIDEVEVELGSWVRGQLVLMFVIGNITFIALTLLGIPYALPLAVLAGLLEILPNLGPTIAAVPAIAVALVLTAPPVTMGIIVALLYVLIQIIENNIVVPRIMKAAVNVDALTSILSILIGVKITGVMGALLAIPTFILLRKAFVIWKRESSK